jgi:multidrug efflux system membrane fusion protein
MVGLAVASAACGSNTSAAGPGGAGPGGGGGGRRGRGGDSGAAPVVATKVTQKDVPVDLAAIGNVEAYATISIRGQITGLLQDIAFREGDSVKKGQELFTLDKRPFEAALAQAEANLTRDKALLAQSEAQLARDASNAEYQQLTSERQSALSDRGIISKDQAQQSRSQSDATAAVVKADRAAIDSARAQLVAQDAAVDAARVNLGYTVIRSPIDGRSGAIGVKTGGLVTANNTELVSIARVDPVYVTFSVPAVHLPTIKNHMREGALPVIAVPQDADSQPANGKLSFVDNAVDMTTDTIKLKAIFDNPDRRLWPGQFARVTLRLDTLAHAVVVPSQAVQTDRTASTCSSSRTTPPSSSARLRRASASPTTPSCRRASRRARRSSSKVSCGWRRARASPRISRAAARRRAAAPGAAAAAAIAGRAAAAIRAAGAEHAENPLLKRTSANRSSRESL